MHIKPKFLRTGERISQVKNNMTGDVFFTSNLYEKLINGETYIGVFTKSDDFHQRKVNWMRKDSMIKVKER